MTDRIDPLAAAIDHIRRITPSNDPWTAKDIATELQEPGEVDDSIATILNAVVSGQLISRHSRDEMLAQVRRDEGFATAGAEARWIADSEAGVYDTDAPDPIAAARALIEPLREHREQQTVAGGSWWEAPEICTQAADAIATLADALEDSRMTEAALRDALRDVERERDAAASLRPLWMDEAVTPQVIAAALAQLWEKLGATTQTEACGNLDKMLAEARLDGWRAGRDAAAHACDWGDIYGDNAVRAIRALPEPKEARHDD